jgi:hypothetical protein
MIQDSSLTPNAFRALPWPRMGPVACLALAVGLSACGGGLTYRVEGTSFAVGSDLTVMVNPTEDGNRAVASTSNTSPPPARIGPGHTYFSVWFVPDGSGPVHAGYLRYDADGRTGSLSTVTPHQGFTVLVTAENERPPRVPSQYVLFRLPIDR